MSQIDFPFFIEKQLNKQFDEILNCDVENNFSDPGFRDGTKMMVRPRAGTELVAAIPGSGTVGDIMWFSDDDNVRRGYIAKGTEVYQVALGALNVYVGYFETKEDFQDVVDSPDNAISTGDYAICGGLLYFVTSGNVLVQYGHTFVGVYDNQADLELAYPSPSVDSFALLEDANLIFVATNANGYNWTSLANVTTTTAINAGFTVDAQVFFNVVSLPRLKQNATPLATSLVVTAAERVHTTVANPENYVGMFLMITSGAYKNKYAFIQSYDSANSVFLTVGLGNAEPITIGTTYDIYRSKGRYIQMTNGFDNDKYFNGTAFSAEFEGAVKTHLSKFVEFGNRGPKKMVSYGNRVFTSIGGIVYPSEVSQPLWYNLNDIIDLQQDSGINDIYIWKNRIVAGGDHFNTMLQFDSTLGVFTTTDLSNSYGVVTESIHEVLEDIWYLSTNKEIISLQETQLGNVVPTNIGSIVHNFLQDFDQNICAGFDSRRYYLYGEKISGVPGKTVVYDTQYKFWSVHSGYTPRRFIFERGIMYFIDRDSGNLYAFRKDKRTDGAEMIEQRLESKDIDFGQPFIKKDVVSIAFLLQNINQNLSFNIYGANNARYAGIRKVIKINKVMQSKPYIGAENIDNATDRLLGNNILGGNQYEEEHYIRHWHTEPFTKDTALVWRFSIENEGTNGFFLSNGNVEFAMTAPAKTHIGSGF